MTTLHDLIEADLAEARKLRELFARKNDLHNFCRLEERVNTLKRVQEQLACVEFEEPVKVRIAGGES